MIALLLLTDEQIAEHLRAARTLTQQEVDERAVHHAHMDGGSHVAHEHHAYWGMARH